MRIRLGYVAICGLLMQAALCSATERWRDRLPETCWPGLGIHILTLGDVQSELELTDAQKQLVSEAEKKSGERLARMLKDRNVEEEGIHVDSIEDFQRKAAWIDVEEINRVAEHFTRQQRQRALELAVQFGGVGAMRFGQIASRIGLSDAQRNQIDEAIASHTCDLRTVIGKDRGAELRAKILDADAKRDASVKRILTDEQWTKFERLKGAPSKATEK